MAQDILSEDFAREAAAAGRLARQAALEAGLGVPSFDEVSGQFYIEQSGHRFFAEFVDGQLVPTVEIKSVDAA